MVAAGVRLRYMERGQRAEERRGRGVQSGCTAMGGRRFGGFGAKPSPTQESGKLRGLLRKASRRIGLWAGNARKHTGLMVWASNPSPTFSGLAEAWTR